MLTSDLDLDVPDGLIAQRPAEPRDSCRLLVVDRSTGALGHRVFRDLPDLLRPGDVLVVNDSKVIPARLSVRKGTGGVVELLFLRPADLAPAGDGTEVLPPADPPVERWEVLARPSRRLRAGMTLLAPDGTTLLLEAPHQGGRWVVARSGGALATLLERHGDMPLPPYIRTPLADAGDYQTVFARPPGSAAAPTAGLHLTHDLVRRLDERGVGLQAVTLHVGLDTFRPVTTERVEEHAIHRESYHVDPETVRALDLARADGRRLIAVGTTVVRVLETLYRDSRSGGPATGPAAGWADLFITPGYGFRAVDGLVTNFHLPRTTLLALVMAFAGISTIRGAYAEAVARGYRFYSFGDAMLIADDVTQPRRDGEDR